MQLKKEVTDRYTRFWNREKTDRACIFISRHVGEGGFRPPRTQEEAYLDAEYREPAILDYLQHTQYDLDGFPSVGAPFGAQGLCSILTGYYRLAPTTIWYESDPPYIENIDDHPPFRLDKNSEVYRFIDEIADRMLTHSDICVTEITNIGCTFDILSAMIGSQNMLYEMADHPDKVKKLRDEFIPVWVEYYLYLSQKLMNGQGCVSSWMPVWSDVPYYPIQCDMSAMISPEMFREFVLPDLAYRSGVMGRTVYHLDGPDEIRHLDMILSLPRLNAVQWVAGAGNPISCDPCWYEMFRQIQAAGKGIILNEWVPHENLENLLRNVDQRGLYLITSARDEQEANEIADMAVRLNKEYKE